MKRSVLVYGISTALNRGGALLYLPFLTQYLSLAEYGVFSLAQVIVQLAWPLFILNGSVAVMREGPENESYGLGLLNKFFLLSFLIGIPALLLVVTISSPWVYLALGIAWMEGLHQLVFAWFRVKDSEKSYLAISFLRSFGLFFVFAWGIAQEDMLFSILFGQALYYGVLFAVFFIVLVLIPERKKMGLAKINGVLTYCLFLLPHMGAQWIMSSSDRFIIKELMSDEAVGIYSVGYTVSMCLMLLNSGIAIALPQIMIKNYSDWLSTLNRQKYFKLYLVGALFIQLGVCIVTELDHRFFGVLPTGQNYFPILVSLVSMGLFCLGFYYFYVNYIFYKRDTAAISKYTAISAIINVGLTFLLVPLLGVVGAALGTFITYVCYLTFIIKAALRLEPEMDFKLMPEIRYMGIGIAAIVAMGLLQWVYW